jgi:DNA-binding CsgD family transcriptional regulator
VGSDDRDAGLLDRDRELESIGQWLSDARHGGGRFALLRAGAGLGKTAVLAEARRIGTESGFRVLSARGRAFEEEVPFGVVRQLLEVAVHGLDESSRTAAFGGAARHARSLLEGPAEPASPDLLGLIHGLYWLVANLSEATPLLLLVDDLHWADSQTARWLGYLAPRVGELPVLVLAAAREGEGDSLPAMLDDMASVTLVPLAPLGIDEVATLVRDQFGQAADREFAAACHSATGGNPFLAIELLRASAADGIAPTRQNASALHQLGSTDVGRSILIRLGRLGEPARRVATAVAVLGADAEIRHVVALSGLSSEQVLVAWDVLARTQILQPQQPLEFIHPIVRSAVYSEIPPGERTRAHRHAAGILHADGADPQHVAAHAFACEPLADSAVVGWLRDAAGQAVGSGAPDSAARYLERALREPPPADERAQLHFELGLALADSNLSEAATNLDRAAALAPDRALRMLACRWAGYLFMYAGRTSDGLAAFDAALELANEAERGLLLAGSRDTFAAWWLADPDREGRQRVARTRVAGLRGHTPGERRALAAAAINICLSGAGSVAEAMSLVEAAGSVGVNFADRAEGDETAGTVGTVALLCDAPGASVYTDQWLETLNEGRILQGNMLRSVSAQVDFRRGELASAEADARASWETVAPMIGTPTTMFWWVLTPLIQVLIGRGLIDEAATIASSTAMADADLDIAIFPFPAILCGQLAIAHGRSEEGIAMLLDAGAELERRGFANPSHIPWRALVAPALASAGRGEEAKSVIAVGLEQARRFGSPWALGMALRAAGTVHRGEAGMELLREAIAVLEPSPCRLEHAHALLERGAAMRRSGARAEARGHLRAALDMASRCAATPLVTRAEQELAASGARTNRVMLSGPDSLTVSERRVAELAARGLSNPEIAQTLFITRKTVETHLGHAYSKLDISRREDLARALAG